MVKIKFLTFNREYGGKTVAHARLFKPGISFDNASIGRVVVDENYRSKKMGTRFNARPHAIANSQ
jgi:predicted GNAT family N-acyltransferase